MIKKLSIFFVVVQMLLGTAVPVMATFEWTNEFVGEFAVYEDFSGSGSIKNKANWQKIGPRGPSYKNGILSFGAAVGEELKNTTAARTFDQISSENTRFAVVDMDFKLTTKAEGMMFNVSGSTVGNYITEFKTTLSDGKLELWTEAGPAGQDSSHFTLIDDVESDRWYSLSIIYDLVNQKADYYVDNIMKPKELTGDDMLKLQTIFRNNSLMISDTIIKSMEIISELTNYTSIVLGKSSDENLVSKVEVVPLDDNKALALVITDKGHIEHRNIVLKEKVELTEIKQTVDLINKLIVGTPINEVSVKLEYDVKPIISQYIKQHEVLYNAFYNAFSDFTSKPDIKVSGTKNILMQPEFDDTNKIREIMSKFEDKDMIERIENDDEDNGVNIYIGSENDFDDDVTIIKTKYSINGEEGTIALIGPKRMEYDRVTTLLNYIKENIGKED